MKMSKNLLASIYLLKIIVRIAAHIHIRPLRLSLPDLNFHCFNRRESWKGLSVNDTIRFVSSFDGFALIKNYLDSIQMSETESIFMFIIVKIVITNYHNKHLNYERKHS